MNVHKAYKVKLYPNQAQEKELERILFGCKFVWNYFLTKRDAQFYEGKGVFKLNDMSRELTQLRKTAPELQGIQLEPLSQVLRRLDKAYRSFYRKEANKPKLKRDYETRQSFQKHLAWRFIDGRLQIQQGLRLKYRGTIPPTGSRLGTLVVCRVSNTYWYATIFVQEDIQVPIPSNHEIGIDLGIKALATTSDGKTYDAKKYGYEAHQKIAVLHKKLSRQEIGSKRYLKTQTELARAYHKLGNKRFNHTHQISDSILKESPKLIGVETLPVRSLLKNRKLARSISEMSWGSFVRMLKYKAEWRGGKVVEIDRFYPSSKTCSNCFFITDSLPLDIREWVCPQCGTAHDRDINAAKNILVQALAHNARGDSDRVGASRVYSKSRKRGLLMADAKI